MKPRALGPAQVHAQQHLRPVLGLQAPGPGMDADDSVVGVEFPREQALLLEAVDFPLQPGYSPADVPAQAGIVLVLRELGEFFQFPLFRRQLLPDIHRAGNGPRAAQDAAGVVLIVPEVGAGGLFLELLGLRPLALYVKDTPFLDQPSRYLLQLAVVIA